MTKVKRKILTHLGALICKGNVKIHLKIQKLDNSVELIKKCAYKERRIWKQAFIISKLLLHMSSSDSPTLPHTGAHGIPCVTPAHENQTVMG